MTEKGNATEYKRYSLTPTQENILVETLLEEKRGLYNMVSVMRIRDRWDDDFFKKAFRLLGVRYGVLLTAVEMDREGNRQYVDKSRELPCEVCEAENADAFVEYEKNYGFDVKKDCLFHGRLVHCPDCDRLIENAHHLILDGFSYYLVNRSLIEYYDLLAGGTPYEEVLRIAEEEAKGSLSFEEYVSCIEKKNLASSRAYWKGLLGDYDSGVIKPPGSAEKGKIGRGSLTFRMSDEEYKKVRDFSMDNLITVSMFAKTVWSILLQKYTYTDDILFGDATGGRFRGLTGIQSAVGLFFNVLPVRVDCRPSRPIREIFADLRTQQVKGVANGYLSTNDILHCAKEAKSIGTFFNFMPRDIYYYSEDDLFRMEKIVNYSGYDLEWYLNCDKEFTFDLIYNTDIYTEDDARRLGERIFSTFRAIMEHPDATVGQIDVLSEREKKELDGFNDTVFVCDEDETVVERFEKQASKTPDRPALVFYDRSLTYKELDERSDGVAALLKEKGIKKGDVVAVYTHRSPEMIVALFGVLKAGGVYLPLDESYPKERLSFVLSDSGAKAVLSDGSEIETSLPVFIGWEELSAPKQKLKPKGKDRAYIIYTSGTTGRPKGVVSLHKGLVNLILSYERIYDLTEKDVVLQVASYTFDQSVWDIFGILCKGGKLALITSDDVRDPERIADYCDRTRVTVASFTPAMLAELDPNKFSSLRVLDSSGEAASAVVLKRWVGKVKVINTYGPTEYTVNSCSYEYKGSESENVPIGNPINNTRFFVLGKGDSLCGVGMYGELCVAGDGIAEGYLDRPDLSEKKFVPAFDGKGKMYRTGDLVRWLGSGAIEFIDRIDGQVKIRGYRIELGEIDAVLRKIAGVKDCFVGVENRFGGKAIAAYIVGDTSPEAARAELKKTLPEYMVPRFFASVDRIPRTVSGKVDRSALPKPTRYRSTNTRPLTVKEEAVAAAWKELLQVEAVMPEDDFFEMGGDSIKAIRLTTKCYARGLSLSVKDVMTFKTLEGIAAVAEFAVEEKTEKTGVMSEEMLYAEYKFGKDNVEKVYHLTPLQEGLLFHALCDENCPEYNTQVVVESPSFDVVILSRAITLVARRYEVLRTAFLWTEEGGMQVILKDRLPEFISLHGDIREIAEKDLERGFDIEKDPLCRVIYVQDGDKKYIIQNSHHLIVDGWSSAILLKALRQYYRRLKSGEKYEDIERALLARKEKSTFSNFVERILSKDKGEAEKYYNKLLEGFDGGVDFPSAAQRSPLKKAKEKFVDFGIDLSDVAKKLGTTESVLCMTAWGVVLGKVNLTNDAIFGNVISGRNEKVDDIDEMVGMFINTVPVRVKFDETTTLAELVESVSDQNAQSNEYGFLPLFRFGHKVGSLTVFDNFDEGIAWKTVRIADQTGFDLEMQVAGKYPNCYLRYNPDRYSDEEIDSIRRYIYEVFTAMKEDVFRLVKDVMPLSESELSEYKEIKKRNRKHNYKSKFAPIKTEKEKIVAKCMEEILSAVIDNKNADFFAEGGDSINAIRLTAKLKKRGYDITVKQVMEARTVGKMASVMTASEEKSEIVPGSVSSGVTEKDYTYAKYKYGENGIEGISRLTPLQEGMLYHALSKQGGTEYNTQIVVRVNTVDVNLLFTASELLAIRYEVMRSNFIWTETGGLQVTLKNRYPEVKTYKGDIFKIADADLRRGFDIEQDPLFRVLYVEDGDKRYLIQNSHHLVLDGWSNGILFRKIREYYLRLKAGETPDEIKAKIYEEKEGKATFKDFVEFILKKNRSASEKHYKDLVRDFNGGYEYPSEGEKLPLIKAEERKVSFDIDLSALARTLQTTEKVLCQVAWGVFLGIATNKNDALFGNVVSGRNEPIEDIENMVGMFINTVPIRVRFDKTTTFKELIKQVDRQNADNTEYGFVPLSSCGKRIETVVVFDAGTVEGFPQLVQVSDQTEYDLEAEITEKAPDCILRYNGRRYKKEEIDRVEKYLARIYKAMTEETESPVLEAVVVDVEDEKVFRRSIESEEIKPSDEERAPRGEKEELVAKCFSNVLGVSVENATADFFAEGGDSIKAIRLSALLRNNGFEITVKQIMTLRTPEKIASAMLEKIPEELFSVDRIGIGVTEKDYAYAKYRFGEKNIESISRLTPLQEGMLFHALSTENTPVYYTHIVSETERLNVDALKKAVGILAERHAVLRSAFIWTETGGLQVVLKKKDVEFTVTKGKVEEIAERDLWRGFDVSKDSLYRLTYVRGEKDHIIQNTHHIIVDGWSDAILMDDLKYLYQCLTEGKEIERYDAPKFIDYVEYLYKKDKEDAKKYFQKLLGGFNGVTEYIAAPKGSPLGKAGEYRFVVKGIAAGANKLSVTPSTVLQAAWGIAIGKVGLKEDVLFGNVLSGRNDPITGIEKTVGMFINTIPVRVRFDKKKTFFDVVRAVSKQTEDQTEYGFLSLTEIGAAIDTVTVFENFGSSEHTDSGGMVSDQTEYDLEMEAQGEECVLRYNEGRYSADDIEELAGYIVCIAEKMFSEPSMPVEELVLFDEKKREEYKKISERIPKNYIRGPEKEIVGDKEMLIASCMESLLGVNDINANDDFFEMGGDSIKAIRLSAKLRSEGYRVSVKDIVEARTVEGIAGRLSLSEEINDVSVGKIPFTPVIRDFFERNYPNPDGYVQEVLVGFDADADTAERVARKVYRHHDILRAEYKDGELFVPDVESAGSLDFRKIETDDVIKTCVEVRKSIKLSGPMFVCAYIRSGEEKFLYMCAHHLLIDGVSWRILLEDMSGLADGVELPGKTTSYLSWARHCLDKVKISEKERDFWIKTEKKTKAFLPTTGAEPYSEEIVFSEEQTNKLLKNAVRAYGVRVDVVMLSALARAMDRVFGEKESVVTMESHGRQQLFEDVDISRTVGWFTCYYPVCLSGDGEAEECLIKNKEHIASLPEDGIKYQFFKNGRKVNAPEILFNYMGNYDGEIKDAVLIDVPAATDNPEREKLDVEGEIMNGKLTLSLNFNGVSDEVGGEIKRALQEEMNALIRLCEGRLVRRYSSSDLGYADVPTDDFEYLLKKSPVRIAPLTPTQEGMLMCSEVDPDEYLEQSAVRLPFVIEEEKARKCFDILVKKYAVLRTEYVRTPSGNRYQVVKENASLSINKVSDRNGAARRRVEEGISLSDGVPIRIDYCDDVLIVTSHHVMMDAWSEKIIIEDFIRLYNGDKEPETLEEYSFCDFAKQYPFKMSAADRDYWVGLMKGAAPTFIPGHGGQGKREVVRKTSVVDFSDEITSFARRKGVTENVVFESATALFLKKVTGQKDVCFGKVVSGRNAATVRAVGLYISTVPVRVRQDEDVLESVRRQNVDMEKYECCPLSDVFMGAGLSDPFGLLYVFDGMEEDDGVKPLFVRDSTNYGITLGIGRDDGNFTVDISYSTSEYTSEEIDALLSLYADRCKRLVGLETEKYLPVKGKDVVYPKTLTELWSNNAAFTLIDGGKKYAGEVVKSRAESLAAYIRNKLEKGVVGIRCERGVNMIVAIYAAVLSGNAYLPIGTDYPKERVRFMMEDAGCKLLLDDGFMAGYKYNDEKYVADVDGDDLCYVIYTSGSTGRPKGAKISHKAIANRLCWMESAYPIEGGSILQKTPYTFDVSVWEIFRPVLFGGTLVLTPPGAHADPVVIAEYVKKYEITQMHFVPSVYDVYLEYLKDKDAPKVKDLFLSGERLTTKTVKRHYETFGEKSRLHNLYGPTECAVDVSFYDCDGKETEVPIGRPIDNVSLSVFSDGEELPCYLEGEIVVSGVGVGSGYIGEDQGGFTDGKYHTGDVGWKDEEGNVHFVGRKDRQTKIHGLRVEPGEIEWEILRIDGVKDVAVEAMGKGDGYLCAFVVTDKDKKEIEREIERRLPPYMTPSRLIVTEKIPLTPNGKRDLAELAKQASAQNFVLPQVASSLVLDAICEVAGRPIGLDTPFGEAGIGSLDRMRLSVKLAPFGFTFADVVRAETPRELFGKKHFDCFMKFSDGNKKALICIPYAGATGRIYEKVDAPGYDVYAAVGCTFEGEDGQKALEEIAEITRGYEKTVLYAHCLGTMTAVRFATEVPFDKVIFGAHVPDLVSSFFGRPIDSWKKASDDKILDSLKKAGLKTRDKTFVSFFRNDVKEAARIEAEKPTIKTPAVVLLAEDDVLTKSSRKAKRRWKKFLKGEIKVYTIPHKGHYFSDDADFGRRLNYILGEEE